MIARLNFRTVYVVSATLLAASAFAWPLFATALPTQAQAAFPVVVFALVPALLVVISLLLDGAVSSSKTLALLGLLAAVGAAVRIASTGVGGFEAVFIILILGGRAYGARFGFLLGMLTIALSSILWGGFGPWTAFQMFAAGWVGAGAGLLPGKITGTADRAARRREITWLIAYGILASYLFGAIMNLWFWPFGVGPETSISYLPQGTLAENLGRFGVYTLMTSTLTWDTVRAVTTGVGLALIGVPALKALRRAKL
ncbi:MAG: hypothetical protein RL720_1184 [Actinomycetota bacterium]